MWPAAVQAWNVADLAGRGFDVSDHDIAAELHSDVENESAYSSDDEVLGFEALVEQSDRLADEVDNLHSEHVQQLPAHEPGMHAGAANAPQSAWHNVRFELVHEGVDPPTDMTVLQAAFHHVESVYRGSTIAQVELDIKRALARYGPSCGKPAPNNPMCRYPPSYYLCKVICDVGDLAETEVHLCPEQKCPHMTQFPAMSRADLRKHVHACADPGCHRCVCPCGGRRMTSPGPGCNPQPQAPCFFFRDVFQQFFLDSEWYERASAAHTKQEGNFYSNPEGRRILDHFAGAGVSPEEVCLSIHCLYIPVYSSSVFILLFLPQGRGGVL